jgi:hypothetical protein
MPTSGAYEFKLAQTAKDGLVEDEMTIQTGEWGWNEREVAEGHFWRSIYAKCPDCGNLITIWRSFDREVKGHQVDKDGNIHPSVGHSYRVNGVEQCGFHTQPTKLLGFIDRRNMKGRGDS